MKKARPGAGKVPGTGRPDLGPPREVESGARRSNRERITPARPL